MGVFSRKRCILTAAEGLVMRHPHIPLTESFIIYKSFNKSGYPTLLEIKTSRASAKMLSLIHEYLLFPSRYLRVLKIPGGGAIFQNCPGVTQTFLLLNPYFCMFFSLKRYLFKNPEPPPHPGEFEVAQERLGSVNKSFQIHIL